MDTGAMYRAAAWKAGDAAAPADALRQAVFTFEESGGVPRVLVDGEDVTERIRSPEIARRSSVLAEDPDCRTLLVELQRRRAATGDFVVEGRDIGTEVFPDAAAKFYLDAAASERAQPRAG